MAILVWVFWAGDSGVTYQVLVDALVEPPLLGAALPQLLVAVLEAEPVPAELVQAVRVDILDPILAKLARTILPSAHHSIPPPDTLRNPPSSQTRYKENGDGTYTLEAHLVTLLPSFKHSISPRPPDSVLHCM